MIIDYDDGSTIGHGRGYPTGLEHEEKMDVIACLLDEGERTYVNDEHTAWICSNQCTVGEMVTLDESSTMDHTIVRKAKEGELAFGYLLGKPSSLADSLLDEVISYYQNHKNVEKLTDAYYYKAVGFNRKRNFKKSIELYKQAELLTKQSNNRYQQFKVLEGIVFVNAVNSNFHLQLIYAKKALMLSQEVNNKKWEIYSHYWLHLAYSELGCNDSAMAHLNAIPQYLKC